jgi:hypothetical protein
MWAHRAIFIGAVAAICIGCTADENCVPTEGALQGTVTELWTGAGVPDAEVILVDPATLRPVSRLTPTGVGGTYRIERILPGEYAVFIYHDSLVIYDRTGPLAEVVAGQTARHDIRLLDSVIWGPGMYFIAGTVRDAATGSPIPRAYIQTTLSAYIDIPIYFMGITLPEWHVTDESGRFLISPYVATDVGGEVLGLARITATASGYRANTLVVGTEDFGFGLPPFLPVPEEGDSVLIVEIELDRHTEVPDTAAVYGAVQGRVLCCGEPVPDLRVGVSVEFVAEPDTFFQEQSVTTPVPDRVVVTDVEGRFLATGLEPGFYSVHPAYLIGDGYVGGILQDPLGFRVTAGDTAAYGDAIVMLAMDGLEPPEGATVTDSTPAFSWNAPALPAGYTLVDYRFQYGVGFLMEHIIEAIADTFWQVPDISAFKSGDYVRWFVSARAREIATEEIVPVAEVEETSRFQVAW